MRDRESDLEAGERAAKSAGRVTLDDKQVRAFVERRRYGTGNVLDVAMRICRARAMELYGAAVAKPISRGVEAGMLSSKNQGRPQVERREGPGDGRELDCLGPSADDQPDIRDTQISP